MMSQTSLYQRPKESIVAKLSLISLMDIFTILVFFLMLNSGETQKIDAAKFVELPDSIAGKSLHDELTIFVDEESIFFDDAEIVDIATVLAAPDKTITALQQVLVQHTESLAELAMMQEKAGFGITIMADKDVSYEVLKSVMETCREENYRNISLAVNRIGGEDIPLGGSAVPAVPQGPEGSEAGSTGVQPSNLSPANTPASDTVRG